MPTKTGRVSPFPWVKERRRYQNAMAQRRHRTRKRLHIEDEPKSHDINHLQVDSNTPIIQSLSSETASLLPSVTPYKQALSVPQGNINEQLIGESCRAYSGWDSTLQCLDSESERANVALIMAAANLGFRDLIKYGIVLLGSAIDDESFERASHFPFSSWIQSISAIIGDFDINTVCTVALRFLATLQGPSKCPSNLNLQEINSIIFHPQVRMVPNIYQTVSMSCLAFASACVANAHYLRIPIHDLLDRNAQSPFSPTKSSITSPTSKSLLAQSIWHDETRDIFCTSLAPTWEQLTTPHHPFIDTLPWPSFRSRVITAIHSEPPLTDQNELANDLIHGGIRCLRILRGCLSGNEDYTPWDARSWRVEPWFFVKWHSLFDESTARIAQISA